MSTFTVEELTKLPKWAVIKVLALQKSEQDLRQQRMGIYAQAVHDAALAWDRARPWPRRTEYGVIDATEALHRAVAQWEEWASDQAFAGKGL